MSLFIDADAADEAASALRSAGRGGFDLWPIPELITDLTLSIAGQGSVNAAADAAGECRSAFEDKLRQVADGIDLAAEVTRLADVLD